MSVDAKLAALEAHKSQYESTMKAVNDTQLTEFRDRVRTQLAELGAPFGTTAAEVFHIMNSL